MVDVNIQKRSRDFVVKIIRYTLYLKEKKVEYPLRDQLLRCGTSIGANIIEAGASSSRKEFTRFALRSSNETDYWIYLINEVYSESDQSNILL